ncbi:MAG TPA: EF-hand domain-containing protein [Burkholderiales bacterium]|nr:EF-hand domain-containing protein [Burkholderiales bacterium]
MSLIFSLVSGIAGGLFRAGREAYKESSAKADAEKAAADAQPNVVTNAQAATLTEQQRMAALAAHGQHAGSFALHYQSQLAKATDTDHDGTISRGELQTQVVAGGGTSAQADRLYQAMDQNHDGTVSADEFKASMPVPKNAARAQILQVLQAAHEAQAAKASQTGSGAQATSTTQAPGSTPAAGNLSPTAAASAQAAARMRMAHPVDASHFLASLAAQLPAQS